MTDEAHEASSAALIGYDISHGKLIAGADEAGRGCFAGPLVAAAVLLDYSRLGPAQTAEMLAGLDDSKKLSAAARERLYPAVLAAASHFSIVGYSAERIDQSGLDNTNLLALHTVLSHVARPGAVLLSDGFKLPAVGDIQQPCQVSRGDQTSAAIAAASVLAKVTRDRLMGRASALYPGYGFERHAGYGTKAHQRAITELGLTPIHRRSVKGVVELAAGA